MVALQYYKILHIKSASSTFQIFIMIGLLTANLSRIYFI